MEGYGSNAESGAAKLVDKGKDIETGTTNSSRNHKLIFFFTKSKSFPQKLKKIDNKNSPQAQRTNT